MPSPTPIPGANLGATIEFFEEAARAAQAAGQAVALTPGDLLALCKMARSALKLEDDVRSVASYGLQSAVPEVNEASRRVLSGRASLPPLIQKQADEVAPVKALYGGSPLRDVKNVHVESRPIEGCDECGGAGGHIGRCSRLQ